MNDTDCFDCRYYHLRQASPTVSERHECRRYPMVWLVRSDEDGGWEFPPAFDLCGEFQLRQGPRA